ncbi:hypothetical protein SAMN02745784_01219 [Tissierella praeacuta DSM 18095]|uniref:Uncharacterized protein n=1 Tax=Tissierella praeacuta DSM 18095 TaxID=1123404 RepID=A0A1M4UVJ7_9FIRM|nr:hypothetical protein [Tissierella praeacuta]SHE60620.1 hypothetical protein SAMN02745784_01219 [Tissierella praeacuta DSM 18095]SUP02623.1 Uncharacterised protein [Tissierella praeacuta]
MDLVSQVNILQIKSMFVRLTKWEDINDFKLNEDKSKLESIKLKTRIIFLDQYYHSKDIDKINEYIKIRIKEY